MITASCFSSLTTFVHFQGRCGITLNIQWFDPEDPNDPEHVAAANRAVTFQFGWFANPIFINGDYPEVMKQKVRLSANQFLLL